LLGKLVSTLLLLMLSTAYASTPALHNLDNSKNFKKINLSNKESKIANNFKKVYKLARKGIFNKRIIRALHKDILKNKTYKHLAPWSETLLTLSKLKSVKAINTECKKLDSKSYDDLVLNYLQEENKFFCERILLEAQTKGIRGKSFNFNILKSQFASLTSNNFLRVQKNISSLLKNAKRKKSLYRKISSTISGFIIANNITPNKNLISNVFPDPTFVRYLQEKDLNQWASKNIYYREFKKLKDVAFNSIDKNEDIKSIQKSHKEFKEYYKRIDDLLPQKKSISTLLSLSKSYMRRNHFTLAEEGFETIIKKNSYNYIDAVFNLMWSKFQQDKISDALTVLNTHITSKEQLFQNSKVHFWKAKLMAMNGDEDDSISVYQEVINQNPLSFYAILSAKQLSKLKQTSTKFNYLSNLPIDRKKEIKFNNFTTRWVKRTTLWAQFNLTKLVDLEIKTLQKIYPNHSLDGQIKNLAFNLAQQKEYLNSFKVIYKNIHRNNLTLDENTLKILFPKPFFSQIEKATKEFDPIIALSLIRQESGFNKYARSHVGARGLMQLMPNTARQFKRKLKTKHLYNPKLNIKIGTEYFNQLLENYNNNLVYSLAAYNAGEKRVNEWQQEYMTSGNILQNIENIPFLETRKYVKLIFRNIFFYKMILEDDQKDSQALNQIYDIHLGFEG
jgi:soluble lytic murein transglycosylase